MVLKIQLNMLKNKKVILGLNGWSERGHDASAALLVGNKIIAFIEEERYTRKRYSYDSFPINSIAYCLKKAKISVNDIDRIVFGWNMPEVYKLRNQKFPYTNDQLFEILFPKNLYKYNKTKKIEFLDHHLSHISSALYLSGFKEASVLVLDGQGEDESGTIADYKNGKLEVLSKIGISKSLGYMMEAACKYIGLRTSDAGKLMGLAGHGKKSKMFTNIVLNDNGYKIKNFPEDKQILGTDLDEQSVVISHWIKFFKKNFPLSITKATEYDNSTGLIKTSLVFDQKHKDFAYSVQKTLESVITHLIKNLIDKTGCKDIVLSGGIALNCTTNGILISQRLVNKLYVMPATNDAGVSLGAAIYTAVNDYNYSFKQLNNVYLGNEYSDNEIVTALRHFKVVYKKQNNIYKTAAKAISNGKVIAWFQGAMEAGPRALGNRSIVANPAIRKMHESVNEIKSRENWRPLAPSILEEHRDELFENSSFSPFMLQNHVVSKGWYKKIPAVVHTDRTSRYQSVTSAINPKYYKLIKEFYKVTGLPIVMNTSFNIGGEPLVCTPEHAIKTFYSSAIDCMAIGNYWIEK